MNQTKYCADIFKPVFDLYKTNKKETTKEQKLAENYTPDYVIFQKLHKSFNMLENLLKYVVLRQEKYYVKILEQFVTLSNLTVSIPKNNDELFSLYASYPEAIDQINDELYQIINIQHFEGLLVLRKLNPLLYYSVISDTETAERILFFENEIMQFCDLVNQITKKLLRDYIKLITSKEFKESKESKESKDASE
jgi:hypothetical protein